MRRRPLWVSPGGPFRGLFGGSLWTKVALRKELMAARFRIMRLDRMNMHRTMCGGRGRGDPKAERLREIFEAWERDLGTGNMGGRARRRPAWPSEMDDAVGRDPARTDKTQPFERSASSAAETNRASQEPAQTAGPRAQDVKAETGEFTIDPITLKRVHVGKAGERQNGGVEVVADKVRVEPAQKAGANAAASAAKRQARMEPRAETIENPEPVANKNVKVEADSSTKERLSSSGQPIVHDEPTPKKAEPGVEAGRPEHEPPVESVRPEPAPQVEEPPESVEGLSTRNTEDPASKDKKPAFSTAHDGTTKKSAGDESPLSAQDLDSTIDKPKYRDAAKEFEKFLGGEGATAARMRTPRPTPKRPAASRDVGDPDVGLRADRIRAAYPKRDAATDPVANRVVSRQVPNQSSSGPQSEQPSGPGPIPDDGIRDLGSAMRQAKQTADDHVEEMFRVKRAYDYSRANTAKQPRLFETKNFFTPVGRRSGGPRALEPEVPMEYMIVTPTQTQIRTRTLPFRDDQPPQDLYSALSEMERPDRYVKTIAKLEKKGWRPIGGGGPGRLLVFERELESRRSGTVRLALRISGAIVGLGALATIMGAAMY